MQRPASYVGQLERTSSAICVARLASEPLHETSLRFHLPKHPHMRGLRRVDWRLLRCPPCQLNNRDCPRYVVPPLSPRMCVRLGRWHLLRPIRLPAGRVGRLERTSSAICVARLASEPLPETSLRFHLPKPPHCLVKGGVRVDCLDACCSPQFCWGLVVGRP